MAISSLVIGSHRESDSVDDIIFLRHKNHIEPFWRNKVGHGVFGSHDGIEIAYAYALHPSPTGSIAISSGRIESLIKYKELIYNLHNAGYSVFIHDHRGQGLSERMDRNLQLGFVKNFDQYVDDFKLFYDKVIAPKSDQKPMLLCHSMGGAIGALYVQKYQNDFSKVAFSAPMFGIRPALPDWLSSAMINVHLGLNTFFSKRPWYFLGQDDYRPEPFNRNNLTHSRARYEIFRQAYETHSEAQLGGVTNQWLKAAHKAMRNIVSSAHTFPISSLILQASADTIVDNQKQNLIAEIIPNCEKMTIEGAKHEILMESDKYRDPALRAILAFFKK